MLQPSVVGNNDGIHSLSYHLSETQTRNNNGTIRDPGSSRRENHPDRELQPTHPSIKTEKELDHPNSSDSISPHSALPPLKPERVPSPAVSGTNGISEEPKQARRPSIGEFLNTSETEDLKDARRSPETDSKSSNLPSTGSDSSTNLPSAIRATSGADSADYAGLADIKKDDSREPVEQRTTRITIPVPQQDKAPSTPPAQSLVPLPSSTVKSSARKIEPSSPGGLPQDAVNRRTPAAVDGNRSGRNTSVKLTRVSSEGSSLRPPTVWENPSYFTIYKNDGKKYFQCKGYGNCSMQFTRAEHLARHIRKHTGEKPYRCGCRQYFSRLDNLRQHCASAHPSIELKYETTRSGYRSGIDLAPGQRSPCPDEDEYLESIGVDPEFKAKGLQKGTKRRNTVADVSQNDRDDQPPRKAKTRPITLKIDARAREKDESKEMKPSVRRVPFPARKTENVTYSVGVPANGFDLLHPPVQQRPKNGRNGSVDRNTQPFAIVAPMVPAYGSRISLNDIGVAQFRRGPGAINLESNARNSSLRRHSWQETIRAPHERVYQSIPMLRYATDAPMTPNSKSRTDKSNITAISGAATVRDEAELDCLQALADLKTRRMSSMQSTMSQQTAESSSGSSDEAEPHVPNVEPVVHRHPYLEWRPDNFRMYEKSLPITDESKTPRIHYVQPQGQPVANSQHNVTSSDVRGPGNDRISINNLLA